MGEAPVVYVGHVLSPLAGGEIFAFIEASQPVVRVLLPDHEESPFFLADSESATSPKILAHH